MQRTNYSLPAMVKSRVVLALGALFTLPSLSQAEVDTLRSTSIAREGLFPSPSERYYNIRHKTSSLGVGGLILRDDYLSPLNYGGFSLQYSQESSQLRYRYADDEGGFRPLQSLIGNSPREAKADWLSQRHFVVSLGQSENPAGNATISRLQARLSGSRQYILHRGKWGQLSLGPSYTIGAGGLYSSRNGNNPATLNLDLGLGLAWTYSYRLPSERFPMLLRLSSRTDVLGMQFSQNYGESYYELYYLSEAFSKRIHFTYPSKVWGQELRLAIDLPFFDRTIYTLGYQLQYRSSQVSKLYRSSQEHSISLGITRYLRPLGGRAFIKREAHTLPF